MNINPVFIKNQKVSKGELKLCEVLMPADYMKYNEI